jgi:ABC-type multidrug transport system permease subunit
MIRPIKHDKASKHRKSKMFKWNVSMHPFMLVAILAALTMVVLVIVLYYFKFLK